METSVRILPWAVVCVCLLLSNEAGAGGRPRSGRYKHPQTIAAETIKTADGDIFDCVGIHEQPAVARLKDHKVQMRPSSHPRGISEDKAFSKEKILSQIELEDGGCPQGTVPIHRIQNKNTLVKPIPLIAANSSSSISTDSADYTNRWAVRRLNKGRWHGGGAGINVYEVPGVSSNQISSSLIWLINRQAGAVIKAGWTVHPELFGDNKTRLFISYSADGELTNCYNHQCPGFVQVSRGCALGRAVQPLSVYRNQQYIMRVYVFMDWLTGHWWFSLGSPTNYIGYWPRQFFEDSSFDHASEVHFGGYVGCHSTDVYCPPMGNGDLPSSLSNTACFFQEVQYFNSDMRMHGVKPEMQHSYANMPQCYDVGEYHAAAGHGYAFRYGGPGCKRVFS